MNTLPETPDAVTGIADGRTTEHDLAPQGAAAAPVTRQRPRLLREPTSRLDAFAWHRAALDWRESGGLTDDPPTNADEPQCGWFKRRLVKGGPWVPARIWLYQPIDDETGELCGDERLQCEVAGGMRNPEDEWPWLCGNPISESEFDFLTATADWSRRYAPNEPMANPRQAVDWLKVPTPSF